jgi:hypothetical protein
MDESCRHLVLVSWPGRMKDTGGNLPRLYSDDVAEVPFEEAFGHSWVGIPPVLEICRPPPRCRRELM